MLVSFQMAMKNNCPLHQYKAVQAVLQGMVPPITKLSVYSWPYLLKEQKIGKQLKKEREEMANTIPLVNDNYIHE